MSVKIRRITAFLLALSLLCTLAVQTALRPLLQQIINLRAALSPWTERKIRLLT